MLLASRPVHLNRVRFAPCPDPNPHIRLRSPANISNHHLPPSDSGSPEIPPPTSTPERETSPYDLHRPIRPSHLLLVADVPERPSSQLQRRLSIANLGTPGGSIVGFPRTHRRDLSTPRYFEFKGSEITVISTPSTPLMNSAPGEVHKPSDPRTYLTRLVQPLPGSSQTKTDP
jgi:hypothetical protein